VNSALISDCGKYRYQLTRQWAWATTAPRTCMFVMLNPSTATAIEDDPTIRRCVGFAKSWGYDRLLVGNLYACRATDPRDVWQFDHPVGPDNDKHLAEMAAQSQLIVAAWGANAKPGRCVEVLDILRKHNDVHFLQLTQDGQPKHPLYLKSSLQPQLLGDRLIA
jgi:hypothetical protein